MTTPQKNIMDSLPIVIHDFEFNRKISHWEQKYFVPVLRVAKILVTFIFYLNADLREKVR